MYGSDGEEELPSAEIERAEALFEERPKATIYRVPREIYACDPKAYVPKAVSIGPCFYPLPPNPTSTFLGRMQRYKEIYKKKLISKYHLPEEEARKKMMDLLDKVAEKYSVKDQLFDDRKTFTDMLMLDGCFLLYLLLRYADGADNVKVDDEDGWVTFGRLGIWDQVRYDLLLLQNQIPFFVIQELNELLPDDKKKNLVDCALNFYRPLHPCRNPEKSRFYKPVGDVHHLLHLIYSSILPCPQLCRSFPKPKSSPRWIPSATELQLAGIKFKKRKESGGFLSFLDVQFSNGVMEIPELRVYDYSMSLFRNLIALEQCLPGTESHVTAYAFFMNFLINTEEDMRLLHMEKILINSMTVKGEIKDTTHLFSRLCNEVHYGDNYLGKLFSDVTEYHGSTFRTWRAEVYRTYFKSPLTVISLIGGLLILVFQFTQFIHTTVG